MQVSGDGEPLMAQAGDTLLSRKSQGALKVDISAASAASTSDAQPAADFGPTSSQGTSQLVRYYPFSRLFIICLHVRKPYNAALLVLLLEQVVNVFIPDCAVLALQTTRGSMQIDLIGEGVPCVTVDLLKLCISAYTSRDLLCLLLPNAIRKSFSFEA